MDQRDERDFEDEIVLNDERDTVTLKGNSTTIIGGLDYSSVEDEESSYFSNPYNKKVNFLEWIRALQKRAKHHFTTSHAVRNGFLIGLLGVIGMVLAGALSGPLALLVLFGVVALTGAMVTAVAGILAFWDGFKDYRHKWSSRNPIKYLIHEFIVWMKHHKWQMWIGFALFLATTALIITALVAPGPLLVAIGFIGSGFAAMGLTLSTPAAAILTFALIGITAMALLDVAGRIWEAIFPPESSPKKIIPKKYHRIKDDDSSWEERDTTEIKPGHKRENSEKGVGEKASYKPVPGAATPYNSDEENEDESKSEDFENEENTTKASTDSKSSFTCAQQ